MAEFILFRRRQAILKERLLRSRARRLSLARCAASGLAGLAFQRRRLAAFRSARLTLSSAFRWSRLSASRRRCFARISGMWACRSR